MDRPIQNAHYKDKELVTYGQKPKDSSKSFYLLGYILYTTIQYTDFLNEIYKEKNKKYKEDHNKIFNANTFFNTSIHPKYLEQSAFQEVYKKKKKERISYLAEEEIEIVEKEVGK